jgi:C4-dicarboxylate-specific signal transduction histidine kinase
VGGVVRETRESGRRLGETALRILDGTPARDISIETAQVRPVFDWRAMQRWRFDERLLPADSIVSFRAPSLWRDYRREVLIALGGLSIQSILIVGLLYERRARRRAEVDSRRSLALAADANRRVTMSARTGSIAHELSQPLNAILHNARAGEMLVASNRATPDVLQELLADICTADVRATQIVERHRTMLKSRALDRKRVDIHGIVRESIALVAHDIGTRHVQVDLNLPVDPCFVVGDHVLLQQVLVNLMMNAMEAMAETPPDRRRIWVRSDVRHNAVEVSVGDAGTGLPSTIDGHLFEPFVTTKANGIGIGLTIARSIVEAHLGRIDAHTNADGGATLRVTLPCDDASSPNAEDPTHMLP